MTARDFDWKTIDKILDEAFFKVFGIKYNG